LSPAELQSSAPKTDQRQTFYSTAIWKKEEKKNSLPPWQVRYT